MAKRKAAVIGSGFGGLSAAIRLQASGFDVTVFEKRVEDYLEIINRKLSELTRIRRVESPNSR